MLNFFGKLIDWFDDNDIPYMLSGSIALSLYITPRATRDFDFVVHLQESDVERLMAFFKSGYYCDEDAVREAVRRKSMFNIIDHQSGYKADFVILKNSPFRQTEFNRRTRLEVFGKMVYVVTPEDLLLSKLIWIQDIQSAIQAEDIKNLAALENISQAYILYWVKELDLRTFNLIDNLR
jgi:hypothetical protein